MYLVHSMSRTRILCLISTKFIKIVCKSEGKSNFGQKKKKKKKRNTLNNKSASHEYY